MTCSKCGTEFRQDSLYCPGCGRETQYVSDINLLEEELLRELLRDDNEITISPKTKVKNQENKKKNLLIPIVIIIVCLACAAVITFMVQNHIYESRENSFDYQITQAETCISNGEYIDALIYYQKALALRPNDIETRMTMIDIYLDLHKEKPAINYLKEIISIDKNNKKAYEMLIELYEESDNYSAIMELKSKVTNKDILKLFSGYEVSKPYFDLEPGVYKDNISISIISDDQNDKIYFTMDGTDPIENGILFKNPILISEESTVRLKTVVKNQYGMYSNVTEGTFIIRYGKPQPPKATPSNGTFEEETKVLLIGPEGSKIYYTWDGTIPTIDSELYTEPILVPEGDNILSAILIDKNGKTSDVIKCNYRYFPVEEKSLEVFAE